MPAARDRTFTPESLYGSNEWVSLRLGLTKDNFFRKRQCLYSRGFPRPDPDTGHYLKADVDAWITQQRRLSGSRAIMEAGQGVRTDGI